jgi:hypothetical protein
MLSAVGASELPQALRTATLNNAAETLFIELP